MTGANPKPAGVADVLLAAAEITCPLCGDTDFDAPGFVNHIERYCEKADAAREEFAEYERKVRDIAIAARARSRAIESGGA